MGWNGPILCLNGGIEMRYRIKIPPHIELVRLPLYERHMNTYMLKQKEFS
mgnify:CR=1 FL=1